MIKFCVVYGTWRTTANFSYFHLELNAVFKHVFRAIGVGKGSRQSRFHLAKYKVIFHQASSDNFTYSHHL